MSTPLPDSGIHAHDAPPPYEAVSSPGAPADLVPEKAPLPDNVEEEAESSLVSAPPPPFTVTPGTLILAPGSAAIRSAVSAGRPLYQLSKRLNGHAMSVTLLDVDEYRPLDFSSDKDKLYKIYEHRNLADMNAQVAEVSAQKTMQFHGVRLKMTGSIGLIGSKKTFEATWGDDLNRKIVYKARQKKGILEWRDDTDRVVAIDNQAVNRDSQESLEILCFLDKRNLDFLVALWVARIWIDTQAEGKKEDRELAKRRKSEQKQLDKEEGRPQGPLHDMKEALGIGYGVRGPSNGIYPGGMPGTNQNGRINWGGSRS